jgi:putative exporter of polyketide antibiotics
MSYDPPPPPPPYGDQPQYGRPYGAPQGTNSKAVWSLVLGILGILCCSPLGIVALFLGRSAQAEIAQTGQQGAGLAKAGFILGVISIVLLVLSIILFATGVLTFDGTFDTT